LFLTVTDIFPAEPALTGNRRKIKEKQKTVIFDIDDFIRLAMLRK
jgi:hypothetical protein